jgi:hypothetical protein
MIAKRRPVLILAIAGALCLTLSGGATAGMSEPTAQEIEGAKTAADHEALAKQYTDEAADLRKQAARHETMAKAYEKGSQYPKVLAAGRHGMVNHCKALAERLTQAAVDAEEMAKQHSEMAVKAK